ncbi:transglycosylase domain-containing protein [Niveibacterium umoris]|uniref:peptidoglycan glycosyltransferase n=1 Tax=Niveibacterium umoris TaxID=1193620 RepID=A0A840BJE6_9RHOO|nr:penicillin-binding protein 1C [Niveibacterium umoris]
MWVRLGLLALLLCSATARAELPTFEQVRAAYRPSDAVLLDRNGEPLADLRFDPKVRRFEWVPLAQFSPSLREALIAAEDHRFYEHEGVDWRAFIGSLWHNLLHDNKRGGSTLTMQLAGLLDPAIALPNVPGGRRTYAQKWDQGLAAQELEQRWTKAQILEAYLNLAPFRGDLQGVHAASAVMFGKPPSALDRPEALLITALLPSPNGRAERVAKRACARARKMGVGNLCPRVTALSSRLDAPRNRPRYTLAPHLAQRVLHAGGAHVTSTLDSAMQQAATTGLREAVQAAARHVSNAAVIVLDQGDASVRAWVGGIDANTADAVTNVRSQLPALWLPFAAANAIERRSATAASLFATAPVGDAPWKSLRTTLQQPDPGTLAALLTLAELPIERLRQVGVEMPRDSTAPPEANLLQVAQALRPLSSGGTWQAARWLSDGPVVAPRRIWRSDVSFIVADTLADPTQRGQAAELMLPDAGWQALWWMSDVSGERCIAYSAGERVAVAVLVSGEGSGAESPARLAARALREIVKRIGLPASRAPRTPSGLVQGVVAFEPPVEPARREWFLRGTEVGLSAPPANAYAPAHVILQPASGVTRITLRAGEALTLEARDPAGVGHWWAEGELLGEGSQILWAPPAGHYRIELRAADGTPLDQREFDLEYQDSADEK